MTNTTYLVSQILPMLKEWCQLYGAGIPHKHSALHPSPRPLKGTNLSNFHKAFK